MHYGLTTDIDDLKTTKIHQPDYKLLRFHLPLCTGRHYSSVQCAPMFTTEIENTDRKIAHEWVYV